MLQNKTILASSFRDPAGFLFHHNTILYRQINASYQPDFTHLMQSGLYEKLVTEKMLISHTMTDNHLAFNKEALVIQPEKIPFISYPYEWCFSQIKEAALLTLTIQLTALQFGMTLKDASSYNIQFHNGKPIFIDTLSFTQYKQGKPWEAYRQFCQHFLAPLLLMCYTDIRLHQLLKIYIDGIPLDLTSKLLPFRTRFSPIALFHIHLHAHYQKKYQKERNIKKQKQKQTNTFNLNTFKLFINNLLSIVKKITWKIDENSEWHDYYTDNNNYHSTSFHEKEHLIHRWLQTLQPPEVWDIGANTGHFAHIAAQFSPQVIAWDIDASCVENHYLQKRSSRILPLLLDVTNPTPSIGWEHEERQSFMARGPTHTLMALGLLHHLAIVNNVPLEKLALFFARLTTYLIIEFIPKNDSQVQKLLSTRTDIFDNYCQESFEYIFSKYFDLIEKISIVQTQRTLYLFKKKDNYD